MRLTIPHSLALLMAVALVTSPAAAAQTQPSSAGQPLRSELAFDYTYIRSNAPPGGCGCFNLNGGSGSYAWDLRPTRFALVGEVTGTHAGSIGSGAYNLTLTAYTAGVRYLVPVRGRALRPFGQLLIGAAHGGGSLVEGTAPPARERTVFTANLGGGLDLRVARHFSIRLIDASYLVSVFQNQVNDHQNNLRLSAGAAFRF